jgi:hypothetical protein
MSPSLANRVAALETQVKTLRELPADVAALDMRVASLELQFLQSRAEVKEQFLITRRELGGEIAALSGEIAALCGEVAALSGEVAAISGEIDRLGGRIGGLDGKLDTQIDGLREELGAVAAGLREEIIRTGEKLWVLIEDKNSRKRTIREG